MSDVRQQAQAYFGSYPEAAWHWVESGNVLVWRDGTTIAFREELTEILGLVAGNGLPPFPAVATILAACRGKVPGANTSKAASGRLQMAWDDPANQEFSEFIARLKSLQELPAELRSNPKAKAMLLEMLLENLTAQRITPGRDIVQELARGLTLDDSVHRQNPPQVVLVRLYRQLHEQLKKFTPESLALRIQTGLDEIPEPADVPLQPAARVRELLIKLQQDAELQGLARVTRDVMAALYIPRSLSEMEELALGGFSDISNRGNLDRLLPSELANDDLTLSTRVALNEALYFRREPPANHPPGHFAILLDAGLRQWGLPRVFATAVALALIVKEGERNATTTWLATFDGIEEIDLLSRKGLVKHLGSLETYVHPGASLKPFFTHLAEVPQLECVLITNRDVLADADFQATLSQLAPTRLYVATVDRDGSFELFLYPHRNTSLCRATISLEELFPKTAPAPNVGLRKRENNSNLPLILFMKPFPLLLPVVGKVEKAISLPAYGGIAAMQDRQLLWWSGFSRGATLLHDHLPKGKTLWIGTLEQGTKIIVFKYRETQRQGLLTVFDTATRQAETHELPVPSYPLRIFLRGTVLYLIHKKSATAFDALNGQNLATATNPHPNLPSNGRYFARLDGGWLFINHNGRALEFHPVMLPKSVHESDVKALFDREGSEGPWALTERGGIFSPSGECRMNLGYAIKNFQISEDGNRILIPSAENGPFNLIDLEHNRSVVLQSGMAKVAFPPSISLPTRNVRLKFVKIGFTSEGYLRLGTSQEQWFGFGQEMDKFLRLHRLANDPPDSASVRFFQPLRHVSDFSFKFQLASWEDGSRAWLDSRGLLHFKNGDSSVAEVSLVLADGQTAAWASDGLICGPEFYIGDATSSGVDLMMSRIRALKPRL